MNKGRVLIVEDETLIAMELKDRLERNNYIICGVIARGEEALGRIEQLKPDLALMDIHLAGALNGIETARQLRKHTDVPVVYLTAYSDPALVEAAAETAPYGYLVKPFEERELRATIDMALYKHMMEQRVRENERRLSTLFDQTVIGIAEINACTGDFYRLNQRYRDLLGYDQESLSVADVRLTVDPADLSLEQNALQSMIEGRIADFSMEKRCAKPGGGTRWIHLTISRLWGAGENPTSYVAFAQDITDSKKAETTRVQRQKLESLSQLAGGLAHDFNNYLQIILGHAVMAQTTAGSNDTTHNSLRQIESTGLEMAALVKKLTAYAGLWRYTPTPVELHSVIRETIEELQPTIPRKVAVVLDEPTGPAVIWGDAEQIHQMFHILFCNALEAIGKEEGSIRVTVSATTLENRDVPDWSFAGIAPASGAYTVLTVQDNGCGIALKDMERISEPFYSTKFIGRGLGLSAVLGIVRQHRGGLQIDSSIGAGTAVRVGFPFVESATGGIGQNSPVVSSN